MKAAADVIAVERRGDSRNDSGHMLQAYVVKHELVYMRQRHHLQSLGFDERHAVHAAVVVASTRLDVTQTFAAVDEHHQETV